MSLGRDVHGTAVIEEKLGVSHLLTGDGVCDYHGKILRKSLGGGKSAGLCYYAVCGVHESIDVVYIAVIEYLFIHLKLVYLSLCVCIASAHGDYLKLCGLAVDKNGNKSQFNCEKWKFLLDAPFRCSSECCSVMKKNPMKQYEKETGRMPIVATMACESRLRKEHWLIHGCNAFDAKRPRSQPMSFWTEQDVLKYIYTRKIPYASVYGDIFIGEDGKYHTTGAQRTGCMFCMFGCHLEKEPNRFQKLAETHPKIYDYCIGGGAEMDGVWQPDNHGLGLGKVLGYIGVNYEKPSDAEGG